MIFKKTQVDLLECERPILLYENWSKMSTRVQLPDRLRPIWLRVVRQCTLPFSHRFGLYRWIVVCPRKSRNRHRARSGFYTRCRHCRLFHTLWAFDTPKKWNSSEYDFSAEQPILKKKLNAHPNTILRAFVWIQSLQTRQSNLQIHTLGSKYLSTTYTTTPC